MCRNLQTVLVVSLGICYLMRCVRGGSFMKPNLATRTVDAMLPDVCILDVAYDCDGGGSSSHGMTFDNVVRNRSYGFAILIILV